MAVYRYDVEIRTVLNTSGTQNVGSDIKRQFGEAERTTKKFYDSQQREQERLLKSVQRINRERVRTEQLTARLVNQTQESIARQSLQTATARVRHEQMVRREMEKTAREAVKTQQLIARGNRSTGGGGGVGSLALGGGAAAIGAGILGVGQFAARSAVQIDTLRNRFTALEGSVDKANAKIKYLQDLGLKSVGLLPTDVMEGFAQLQAIGGITESSIEKIIKAIGRLNTAFSLDSQKDFLRNLTQSFNQDFERGDVKEALGRVPIFEQILEKAFGTKDGEKLREMKKAGKLTLDSFIQGFAEAVESDTRLQGLGETLGAKFQKSWERINIAAAPLGERLLSALAPATERVVQEIEKLAKDIESKGNNFKEAGMVLGERLGAGIGQSIKAAAPGLSQLIADEIKGNMKGEIPLPLAFNAAVGKGLLEEFGYEGNVRGFKNAVLDLIKWNAEMGVQIVTGFGKLQLHVLKELANLRDAAIKKVYNVGVEIAAGLADGIYAGSGKVVKAILGLSDYAVTAAKSVKAFDIQSPSRVFMEIGEQVVDGLALGISMGEKKIQAALRKLVSENIKTLRKEVSELIVEIRNELNLSPKESALRVEKAQLDAMKEQLQAAGDLVREMSKVSDKRSEFEKLRDALASPAGNQALKEQAAILKITNDELKLRLEIQAKFADLKAAINPIESDKLDLTALDPLTRTATGTPYTPAVAVALPDDVPPRWRSFLDYMKHRFGEVSAELPTIRERMLDAFLEAPRAIGDVFADTIRNLDGSFQGFFKSITRGFKNMGLQLLADLVGTSITQRVSALFGGFLNLGGGNRGNSGGVPSYSGASAIAALGNMVSGTGSFGASAFSGGNNPFAGARATASGSYSGGGFFGNFKSLFSPQKNILTGKTSTLGGILGGVGALASLVGGFIPGRVGSSISMAGMGLSIGSMFGPWGALIGGAAGGLLGLFGLGGDPKRKADKNQSLPALTAALGDAFTQMRQLINDVNSLRVNPPGGALARAQELRSQIATGFGIEFQSKKYRNQSQQMISQRLNEFDTLYKQLEIAVLRAEAAGERQRRIVPEFAEGALVKARPGGMIARIGEGGYDEYVLSTDPRYRRRNAVLLNSFIQQTNAPVQQAAPPVYNFTVVNEVDLHGVLRTWVQTPDGKKHLAEVVEEGMMTKQIQPKGRFQSR